MKRTLLMVALILAALVAPTQSGIKYKLPELHKIKTATLSPSYSCRSAEDFQKG